MCSLNMKQDRNHCVIYTLRYFLEGFPSAQKMDKEEKYSDHKKVFWRVVCLFNIFIHSVTMVLFPQGVPTLPQAPPQTVPQKLLWKPGLKPRNPSQLQGESLELRSWLGTPQSSQTVQVRDVPFLWHPQCGMTSRDCVRPPDGLSAHRGLACNVSKWGKTVNGVIIDLNREKEKRPNISEHL